MICGSNGGNQGYAHKLECHEKWLYDEYNKTSTLSELQSLCPRCHLVKHYGLAEIRNRKEEAIDHLMCVNKINYNNALRFIDVSFITWGNRNRINWEIDCSDFEKKYNIKIRKNT